MSVIREKTHKGQKWMVSIRGQKLEGIYAATGNTCYMLHENEWCYGVRPRAFRKQNIEISQD